MSIETVDRGSHARTSHKRLKFKTYLMILVMVIAAPLGNVLLGRGMKHVGAVTLWPVSRLFHTGLTVFTTGSIWLGISSLIVFFISYMLVLSWADYSFVLPASSISYGVVAILSYVILGEKISPLRWGGIAIICLGVFIVSRTSPRTTSSHHAAEAD